MIIRRVKSIQQSAIEHSVRGHPRPRERNEGMVAQAERRRTDHPMLCVRSSIEPMKLTRTKAKHIRTLKGLKDEDIDFTDIPEKTNWSKAVVGKFYRPIKKSLFGLTLTSSRGSKDKARDTKRESTATCARRCTGRPNRAASGSVNRESPAD